MTFTSIPPSLRPVVEDVARALVKESAKMYGRMEWDVLSPAGQDIWCNKAEAAILAFLNACVERKIGQAYNFNMHAEDLGLPVDRFLINLGATDDTA